VGVAPALPGKKDLLDFAVVGFVKGAAAIERHDLQQQHRFQFGGL
jgi:hypothetical protein